MTVAAGRFDAASRVFEKNQDVLLVLLIVAVVCLILFPLPYAVLDGLIALNIGLSILLLITTIYIPEALKLSTFPSLLLFTTLLRLGLNIASTKLILLHAQGGEVIETFGRLVVGGNYVVGAVIFLIITVVQFIVIAKGAERVAEVGARFTLDALPGKQMSIDADLRGGLLTPTEARAKRRHLERESQMHGAMDGAMKFVKGDAIAGLVISLISIVAGITIGMLMRDMSAGEAAARYTVLTIGDGLVSQIPSLFVTIAAGVLITRVSGVEQSTSDLGKDIGAQLLSQPKALLITGGILLACMLLPGFPKFQFLLVASVIGLMGLVALRRIRREVKAARPRMTAFAADGRQEWPELFDSGVSATARPVMLVVSSALFNRLEPLLLNKFIGEMKERWQRDLGLPFPGLRVHIEGGLPGASYRVDIFDVPVAMVHLDGRIALSLSAPEAREIGMEPLSPTDLPSLRGVTWAGADDLPRLKERDLWPYREEELVALHLENIMRTQAASFIGIQETKILMARAESEYPEVIAELNKSMPIQRITEILNRLVQEQIPLRNLRAIFEALASYGPREKDNVLLTECVRMGLARYISFRHGGPEGRLFALTINPAIEQAVRQAALQANGEYFATPPEQVKLLCDRIRSLIEQSKQAHVVVLTQMEVRRYFKKIIEIDLPELPILSYQELLPTVTVVPIGQID